MELKIGKTQSVWDNLPSFSPPPLTDLACLHGRRPADVEVVVMMRQSALRQIDDHSRSDVGVELGGLLLGNVYQHEDRLYVDIEAALDAKSDKNGPVHFTFTADAWATAHQEREEHYPNLKIVGWFHTHPNLGVFYSGDDVVVHTTAFSLPWHVGLVLDPVRNTVALFGWVEDENTQEKSLDPIQGWYEIAEADDGSVVPWRHRHGQGLPSMRRDAMRTSYRSRASSEGGALISDEEGPIISDGFLTATAMFMALVGLIYTFLVFIPNQENGAVMTAVNAQLAQAQVDEWNAQQALFCSTLNMYIVEPDPQQQIMAGESIIVVGRAQLPGLVDYELQVLELSGWETVREFGPREFGPLGKWHTQDLPSGEYWLRLIAKNDQGQLIQDSSCMTSVQLVSAQ
ncbi:MAG: Mov34/MPN/PAD-1 family protein [Chloroflexota bacterium]